MRRDIYIDSVKFVLIILVVWGHILGAFNNEGTFNLAAYNTIYLFHMPLFLFISGRYSHIRDRKKFMIGILRLLETYIVFQVILSIIFSFMGEPISIKMLTEPAFALWYLVAVIYYRLIIYFFYERLMRHRLVVMVVCLAISLASGFIPVGKAFVIQRSLAFLPFFFGGFYLAGINLEENLKKIPVLVAVSFIALLFVLIYLFFNRNLNPVLLCTVPYSEGGFSLSVYGLLARAVFIVGAVVTGIMAMRCVKANKTMGKLGEKTLQVYIYHQFALLVLIAAIKRLNLPADTISTLLYSVAISWILALLARLRIFEILLAPISYLYISNPRRTPS